MLADKGFNGFELGLNDLKRSSLCIKSASHVGSAGSIPEADFTAAGNFAGCAVASVTIGVFGFSCFSATNTPIAECGSSR
jgi:hypothetical protein